MKVYVAGAINLDIGGQPAGQLLPRESNIGRVLLSPGGVGRNIAASLAAMGVETHLAAAFGSDAFAAELKSACAKDGILLDAAVTLPGSSGVYLYVNGGDGDMFTAINDMRACSLMTPDKLELAAINSGDACVFDCNLPGETLSFLAENTTVPLVADPVSAVKCRRLLPLLPRIHTLKPNRYEAEALTGEADPEKAAAALIARGVQRVFVSLGAEGILYAAGSGERGRALPAPVTPVNTTGAGDSATAALTAALLLGLSAAESAALACKVAGMTILSESAVSPRLTADILKEYQRI